ncbi:hypothetical protein GTG28_04245 [Vibrio sp. OCN044]|uniref:Putative adhesin Stv domain-containing protein n=1 Tax=Vibrio tetraodonis subsp. pristinus TaxID=2695891 RepID=A0A6L8LRL4_9VIBR|nr:hypothetical protein [Vibrio tetraodonis]MYM58425.1 hypothetical protein [Vibrio tetraodonis subsp. pristinus]
MPAVSKASSTSSQQAMGANATPVLKDKQELAIANIKGVNEQRQHKIPSFERPNLYRTNIKLSGKKESGESEFDTVFPLRRSDVVESVYGEIEKECGVGLKEYPLRRLDAALDLPKQLLVEALKDKQPEAIEFIEKGYNELIIEIDKGLIPSLRERIAEIRSKRSSQVSNLQPSEEILERIERFLDKIKDKASVNSDDRGLAYQFARHVKSSIQAVDEALKLSQMNATIGSLSQWEKKTADEFWHSDDFFKNRKGEFEFKSATDRLCSSRGQELMTQHLVKQRTEVMKTLTANNNRLCSLYAKLDRYDKGVLSTDYFSMPRDIIGDIQSLVHESANEFRGKAGTFNKPKDAWEYKPSYVTQKLPFKETISRFFVDTSNKAREAFNSLTEKVKGLPSSTLGVLQELPKQGELASYALNHWRDVGHKKARKVGFDRISAPAGLKAEELKVKSIVRSMYWLMQQPALRMQYDLNPLQAAATNLKKDKPLEADFAAEAMKDLAQAVIDDFSTGKAHDKNTKNSGESNDKAIKVREFNQACSKALDVSKDIKAQVANLPSLLRELVNSHSDSLSDWGQATLKTELEKIIDSNFYDPVINELDDIFNELKGKTSFTEDELGDIIHQTRIASVSGKSDLDNLDLKITSLTSKRLDPFSRHAKVAKDWGMKANEMMPEAEIPTTESLRQLLQTHGLLDAVKSDDDPEGILFATRMCQEWHYARKDKTILPKKPDQHLAEEKSFAEFAVKWGQKQATRGVIYAVIEGGVDLAAGATVTLVKGTVKAGVKTTIASFTIPYKVHQIKTGVMPGEDYPYKVVQDVVNNRLKQLGFKAAMSFVPRPIKTAAGSAIVMSAYAHNAMVDPKDKIKTDSWLKTIAVEAAVTGMFMPVSLLASAATSKVMEAKALKALKLDLTSKQIPEQKQKLLQAYQNYTNGITTQFKEMKQQFKEEMKDKLPKEVIDEMIATQDLAFETDIAELQETFRQELSDSFDMNMQDLQNKGLIDSWSPLFAEDTDGGNNVLDEGEESIESVAASHDLQGISISGSNEYRETVRSHLRTLQQTEVGRNTLKAMNELGITISSHHAAKPMRIGEDGQKYFANFASPLTKTIYFDPHNTLSTSSADELKARPWLECDPTISLTHEVQHISLYHNPAIVSAHGENFILRGQGDPMNEHLISGVDYTDSLGDTFYFSDPKWVEDNVSRASGTNGFVTENDYRRAFYDYKQEPPVLREDYWTGLDDIWNDDIAPYDVQDSMNVKGHVTDEEVSLARYARHTGEEGERNYQSQARRARYRQANKFFTRFNGDVEQVKVKFYKKIRDIYSTDGRIEFLEKNLKRIEKMAAQARGNEQSAFFSEVISLLKQAADSNDANHFSDALRAFRPPLSEVDAEILDNVFSSDFLKHELIQPMIDYHKFVIEYSLAYSEEEFSAFIEQQDFIARQPNTGGPRGMTINDEFRKNALIVIGNMRHKESRDEYLQQRVLSRMNAVKTELGLGGSDIEPRQYEQILAALKEKKEASTSSFDKIIYTLSEQAFESELDRAEHSIRIKNITAEIYQRPSFDEFKLPLLPSEELFVKSHPELDQESALSRILQYRNGEIANLHQDSTQIEKLYFDGLQDKSLPNGGVYTKAQQIRDIEVHGGLIAYERSIIRSHRMAGLLGDLNHKTIAKQYWEQRGISKPENVNYVYRYPELPAANLYTMPEEGDSREVQVEKLEKVRLDVSYYRLIEQKMGKPYFHSVNRTELESEEINWDPEKYSKLLEQRTTALIDAMPNRAEQEYVRNTLHKALNPPIFTTSTEALPFFMKPVIDGARLENMLLIRDGDKYTMISLLPPGKVQIYNSKDDLNAFVLNQANHEFLLSHVSLANQMDGISFDGMESALEDLADPAKRENWRPMRNALGRVFGLSKEAPLDRLIFPYSSENRINGRGVFSSLAVSSIGDSGGGHIVKTNLIQALGESYWQGLTGSHTVEVVGDYQLPPQYQGLSGEALFKKLYNPQAKTDMQRLVEGKINQFEAQHFSEYSDHLKATFDRLVASAERDGKLSPEGKALILEMQKGSDTVEVSIPGLQGKQGDYFPLEGMLIIRKGDRHILVSLQSDGALIEFERKRSVDEDGYADDSLSFDSFFSNPANRNFILSHMSEFDKQPDLPGGSTPGKELDRFEAGSNYYHGTEYALEDDRAFGWSVDAGLKLDHLPLNGNDNIFDTIGRRNLERLRKDADALLTSHAEWNTKKALEIVGGVLAVPAFALSIAAIVVSGGTATPAVVAGVAGAAMIVDAASLGVGLAEGVYLLVEGDSPEERASGLIPLALAPLDALGMASSASDVIKALKALKSARQAGDGIGDLSTLVSSLRRQGARVDDVPSDFQAPSAVWKSDTAQQFSEDIDVLLDQIRRDIDELKSLEDEMTNLVRSYPPGTVANAVLEDFSELDLQSSVAVQRIAAPNVREGYLRAVIQDNGQPVTAIRSSRGDYIFSDTKVGAKPIGLSSSNQDNILSYLDANSARKVTNEIGELQTIYARVIPRRPSARFKGLFPIEQGAKESLNGFTNFFVRTGMPGPSIQGLPTPGGVGKPLSGAAARIKKLVGWEKSLTGGKGHGVMLEISPYPGNGMIKVGEGEVTFGDIAKKLRAGQPVEETYQPSRLMGGVEAYVDEQGVPKLASYMKDRPVSIALYERDYNAFLKTLDSNSDEFTRHLKKFEKGKKKLSTIEETRAKNEQQLGGHSVVYEESQAIGSRELDRLEKSSPDLKPDVITDTDVVPNGFQLIRGKGDPAKRLVISAHAAFDDKPSLVHIPPGKKVVFYGPHGNTLADVPDKAADPITKGKERIGLEMFINGQPKKYASMSGGRSKSIEFGDFDDVDLLSATGIGDLKEYAGDIRNYKVKHYEKTALNAYMGAVWENRAMHEAGQDVIPTDVVVVDQSAGWDKSLRDIIHEMRPGGRLSNYDEVSFVACREPMGAGGKGPSSYIHFHDGGTNVPGQSLRSAPATNGLQQDNSSSRTVVTRVVITRTTTGVKIDQQDIGEVVPERHVAIRPRQSVEKTKTEARTPITKGGTDGFSWPKLSGQKPDSQSLKSFTTPSGETASVVRNKVGDDFMLYTANDGVQANTLLISVHGGYHQSASLASRAPKTGDIKVPSGVTMEFLGPHGRTLSDPSIEIMNNPNFSPHSTVTSSGHTFNSHKTTGSTHMFQRNVVDASGSSDVGSIKDYRIFKYQGRHSGGAETEANIVDAIVNNRKGTTRATDVLTVRERTFAFSEASLSDVFQQLDLKNSQYKYVTFSGCRNELSAANPPNYSNKGGQRMLITVDVSGDTPRVVYAKPIAELLQQPEDDTEASQANQIDSFGDLYRIHDQQSSIQQWDSWVQDNRNILMPFFEEMANGNSEIFREYRSKFDDNTALDLWASVQRLKMVRDNPNSFPGEIKSAFDNAVKSLNSALETEGQ